MVTTSCDELADACRSMRAHGWIRERDDRQRWIDANPQTDPRFLFVSQGYNLRMTEVSGAFGMHQVPRLEAFVERRRRNHRQWCAKIADLQLPLRLYPELENTRHAGFAFPLLLDANAPLSRAELCAKLEERGIHSRPISGSNLARQPVFSSIPGAKIEGDLTVANAIHSRGLFVGQSHAFGDAHGDLLASALEEALR